MAAVIVNKPGLAVTEREIEMSGRDFQKSKVYKWEDKFIRPFDKQEISFDNIQMIVDYVWKQEGYNYPPKVKRIAKQNTKALATGSRLNLEFHDKGIYTWVILHELAHALTSNLEYENDGHGPEFVGVYMKLVNKYIGINLLALMASANDYGVKYDLSGKAWIIVNGGIH